jgi:hypothetical protein
LVYNNKSQIGSSYFGFHVWQRFHGKVVGKDAAALCYSGGTLCLQASGAYCAGLYGLTDRVTDFSPSFAAQTVVFLYPFFSSYRKEMSAMTMLKRDVNSIWSKVREDRDIDDLIFNYDACHASEDDGSSDR